MRAELAGDSLASPLALPVSFAVCGGCPADRGLRLWSARPTLLAPRLSALTGAEVWVKYENFQITASFKESWRRW